MEIFCTFTVSGVASPGEDRPELYFSPLGLYFFVPALLFHMLTHLLFFSFSVLFHSCCFHAQVFGKILVHEFLISYSHTEWYNCKCTKENSVRDSDTSQFTSNPVSTKLNFYTFIKKGLYLFQDYLSGLFP